MGKILEYAFHRKEYLSDQSLLNILINQINKNQDNSGISFNTQENGYKKNGIICWQGRGQLGTFRYYLQEHKLIILENY